MKHTVAYLVSGGCNKWEESLEVVTPAWKPGRVKDAMQDLVRDDNLRRVRLQRYPWRAGARVVLAIRFAEDVTGSRRDLPPTVDPWSGWSGQNPIERKKEY